MDKTDIKAVKAKMNFNKLNFMARQDEINSFFYNF